MPVTVGPSTTVTAGTSLDVDIPASGLAAVFVSSSADALNTPTGWSRIASLLSNDGTYMDELYANDPGASVTLTWSAPVDAHAVAVCVTGPDPGPFDELRINSASRNIGFSDLPEGFALVWPVWYTEASTLTVTNLPYTDRYDRQPSGFDSFTVLVVQGPFASGTAQFFSSIGRLHYFFATNFELAADARKWWVGVAGWGSPAETATYSVQIDVGRSYSSGPQHAIYMDPATQVNAGDIEVWGFSENQLTLAPGITINSFSLTFEFSPGAADTRTGCFILDNDTPSTLYGLELVQSSSVTSASLADPPDVPSTGSLPVTVPVDFTTFIPQFFFPVGSTVVATGGLLTINYTPAP